MVKELTSQELLTQQQGFRLKEMIQLPGWEEILKPFLEQQISHSWVDPRKVKSDEDLLYEYKLAFARAKGAQEILDFIDKSIEEAEALTKKEKEGVVDKLRESVS